MDGSQKLPQRILGTLADDFAAGRAAPGLVLAVAAWIRYVSGTDLAGRPIEVRDPLADRLAGLARPAREPAARVAAILSMNEIFPPELAGAPRLREDLTAALTFLEAEGVRAAVTGLPAS